MSLAPHRPVRLVFAAALGACLAAAPLIALPAQAATATPTATPTAPAAADAVQLNLLNINDFHGRIDENTVKFAGTVETLRAEYGDDSTLFLSDGDNIGASLFASASQQDTPTLEVLNALGLHASAVGNHEFDQGYADLIGRVADTADFDYLGANVYKAGTEQPALKEYLLTEVQGVSVAVIGTVTEETPALVSPNGIVTLSFGDPVAAVNRVAAQLTDGDPDNGEADVIIAEYHEGASAGTVEDATLEQELALTDSAFAKIVTETSAAVDAIFTGHTHKQYAWNAPVPGAEPGVTRPVLQTGNYGENIGQVVLNYDPATDVATTETNRNVPRTEIDDAELVADFPRVAAVQTITAAALAEAEVVGSQPVGAVTADITRASIDGVVPVEEDRAAPSTLGTLVANSLRESLADPAIGGAEIGVVNPGGIRADLTAAPDPVVTYAEANAVLPFVNNLWTTTLTGAQFKTVLEQQWQRDDEGAVPSRPYLQLGLSDNVNYTFDATRAEGDRITGIWVDDEPIDPTRGYRIGSFNFLLTGGDNFREFANGTDTRDSGLIDRDAWISYLTDNNPVTPSYAVAQAQVTGVPAEPLAVGADLAFTVSNLNLTSTGSPVNTELTVEWVGSAATVKPASVDATGTATVTITVPADAPAASVLVLTATESGSVVRVPVTVDTTVPAPSPTPTPTEPAATPTPTEPAPTAPAPTMPGVAPTSAPVSSLTEARRDTISTDAASYRAGAAITITVGAEHAGKFVSVWVRSTPMNLGGWLQVTEAGTVSATLPADLSAGTHKLIVQDSSGAVLGWTEITVTGSSSTVTGTPGRGLASTGLDVAPWLAGGVALLLIGAVLLLVRSRNSSKS
jgi:2',3'-cyclic-nucleotide 2'-phosphodiesterase (5'-nucleotidase family)